MWAGTKGFFDDVPLEDVLRFEQELLEHLRHTTPILTTISETKLFDDDTAKATEAEINKFKQGFRTTEGKLLGGQEAPIEAKDVSNEQIVVKRS